MRSRGVAALLVFIASGAVLVLEILGVRLLAPYVGLTLETYTTIIGVVLGGIALGAAAGGRAADLLDPTRLLAALLVAGGVLALTTVPLIRLLGEAFEGAGQASALALALFALVPGAAVLAAASAVAGTRCTTESVYYCARVVTDDLRPSGRVLVLDDLRHSYVDLDDPRHLEFRYTRLVADVLATLPRRGPVAALHVG